jgi:hypothetical protein
VSVFGILEARNPGRHSECGTWLISQDALYKLIHLLLIMVFHSCNIEIYNV